ncbi:hypothetical protein [Rhodanobacter sp. OK091]|jgi:hypothetical protein|uniref:hypothetical protein n=1 Tax=Rhodanobacter sp. OK091 TaxID=1881037 RepID=UPI0009345605|nr:hypothetical protein [Rhodanobacter sp. OK091]
MKSDNFPIAASVALAVGILQTFLLRYVDAYIAAYSPVPIWLASHVFTSFFLLSLLLIYDWLISIFFCLPAAYILCKLRPRRLFVYLVLAVVPSFLWQHRLVFIEPVRYSNFLAFNSVLRDLFMLPAATAIVRFAQRRRNV